MVTTFHNAVSGLHRAIRGNRGIPVNYVRVANGSETARLALVAVPAETKLTQMDESGVTVQATRRDWIVWAPDLCLSGMKFLPARGDRMEVIVDGRLEIYELSDLGAGLEKHYRASDALGRVLRLHTTLTETRNA